MKSPVGNRIKQLREFNNFTQEFVANELGISVTAYGNIERGETTVHLDRIQDIARILAVHYSHIIMGSYLDHFLRNPCGSFVQMPPP
ncbi:MAG TPA: helix-turn-helix transcriptional regulator [Chitinophagaceae bacterium]